MIDKQLTMNPKIAKLLTEGELTSTVLTLAIELLRGEGLDDEQILEEMWELFVEQAMLSENFTQLKELGCGFSVEVYCMGCYMSFKSSIWNPPNTIYNYNFQFSFFPFYGEEGEYIEKGWLFGEEHRSIDIFYHLKSFHRILKAAFQTELETWL